MEIHHASPQALAKATVGAAVAAALVFTMFVLPAEAGVDPTGVGAALGLTRMSAAAPAPAPVAKSAVPETAAPALPDKSSIATTADWRSDEMKIILQPHSGAEVKAHMKQGDHFVFRWEAQGGQVKVDMHGERVNAAEDEFTSYWEEKQLAHAQGSFTAPFGGTHGWYWRNKGDAPVTVTVRTAGFYRDLFRPGVE